MRIHHVALRTADLAALERFYAGVLGLAVTRRSDDERGARSVWLDAGGTIVMLERREPGEPAPDPRSLELVAFALEAREVAAIRARLGVIEAHTASTLYVRDPDGRRVGLSVWPDVLA